MNPSAPTRPGPGSKAARRRRVRRALSLAAGTVIATAPGVLAAADSDASEGAVDSSDWLIAHQPVPAESLRDARFWRGTAVATLLGTLALAAGGSMLLFPMPGVLGLGAVITGFLLAAGGLRTTLALRLRPRERWDGCSRAACSPSR